MAVTLPPRRYGFVDRERVDRYLLVLAVFLGAGSGILLKLYQFPVWLPALTSAVVIIVYAAITSTSSGARLEPNQIGDNAYYLGFVFTLISFAYTLYELERQPANSEIIRSVISGFGIALTSTIVGVIVRLYLLQYRVDLVAREKEIRLQLNDATRRFHAEVEDVVRGTKYLGAEIRQSLEEHHRHMAESYEHRTQNLVEDISTSFKKILDKLFEQSEETNRRLASSSRDATSNVEEAAVKVLNSVTAQMRETNDVVNESTRETADALKRSLVETRDMMSESIGVTVDLLAEAQRSVKEALSTHSENMEQATAFVKETNAAVKDATRAAVSALELSLKEISEAMSESMSDLRTEARRSVEEVSLVHSENMKHATALMEESAISMQNVTISFAKKFEESLNEMEPTMARLSDVNTQMHEAMKRLTENLEGASSVLAERGGKRWWKF